MKFELDHRTGMMRPKKDEEIYFAQSQGGGLIVDDKKNNIKYIIERDGRITKLFGSFDKDNLNLYDMRDARIIADRVRRLLGVDHKYTDFHYFLRGYRMSESVIRNCSDFLGESIWSDIQDRSGGESVRKEDDINSMNIDAFYAYLNSKYGSKLRWTDMRCYVAGFDNSILIPVAIGVKIYGCYKKDNIKKIILLFSRVKDNINIVKNKLKADKFNVSLSDEKNCLEVVPKDGKLNNQTFVNLIEFFLNNKLNESIWSDLQDRSTGETVRKEEGRIIGTLEDGTRLVISNDAFADGNLVEFDEGNIYTLKESSDEELYIAVINEGAKDVYYMYDEDSEDVVNMVRCFEVEDTLRTDNDFGMLRALISQDEWYNDYLDGLEVTVYRHHTDFEFSSYEFVIYDDRNRAIDDAVEMEEDLLDSTNFTKGVVEQFRNALGDDFLDEDQMKEDLKESQEYYYDDLSEEDAIDELLRWKIIEDTEDYFEVDEDGDVDHTLPKFDYGDYKDEYVEKYMDDISDYVDAYISTYGYDGIENYINKTTLAKKIIESDGPENEIASYDGVEREERIDGTTYYIYRRN